MRMVKALVLVALAATAAKAGPYYDLAMHSSSATLKLSGILKVAASSVTASTSVFTINAATGSGQFLIPFGSPSVPAIAFSSDATAGIWHGPYGFSISVGTRASETSSRHQIALRANTTRIGANAESGPHQNSVLGVGSNEVSQIDIVDTGGSSSNNSWGIWSFPTMGISTAKNGALFAHGIAAGLQLASQDGSANAASTTRILRILSPVTDGTATTGSTYGVYIDSIVANNTAGNPVSAGAHANGIYNLSNYYAPNNDTYIALGGGAFGYQIPGRVINLTNNNYIWSAGNGGATAYNLIGANNSDALLIGDGIQNSIQLQNNTVYLGQGASQATMQRGTLTLPYGIGAATGSFSGAVNASGALTTTNGSGNGVYTNSSPVWDVMNAAGTTGIRYSNTQITPFTSGVEGPEITLEGGAAGRLHIVGGDNKVGIATTTPTSTLDVNGNAQFGSGVRRATITVTGEIVTGSSITAGAFYGYGGNLTGLPGGGDMLTTAGNSVTGSITMAAGSTITISGLFDYINSTRSVNLYGTTSLASTTDWRLAIDTVTLTVTGANVIEVCMAGTVLSQASIGACGWSYLVDGGFVEELTSAYPAYFQGTPAGYLCSLNSCSYISPGTLSKGTHRFSVIVADKNPGVDWDSTWRTPAYFRVTERH